MPLCLSPSDRFSIVLKSDQHLPKDKQPRFVFKHLSGNEQREWSKEFDKLEVITDTTERIDKLFAILKGLLLDWENMGGRDFDLENLGKTLRFQEARELIYEAWGWTPPVADLKNSESQSTTPSD